MRIQGIIAGCTLLVLLSSALPAQALPSSEVIFNAGSNCGSYQGDLTAGRLFKLELESKQELTVKTDGHVQSVQDNQGKSLEDMGGYDYRYLTQHAGTYTIQMVGRSDSEVEFCTGDIKG